MTVVVADSLIGLPDVSPEKVQVPTVPGYGVSSDEIMPERVGHSPARSEVRIRGALDGEPRGTLSGPWRHQTATFVTVVDVTIL